MSALLDAGTDISGSGRGWQYGLWCLGCLWALMGALLALGAMSLVWMALISMLVAAERLLPRPDRIKLVVAAALAVLAIGVAGAPTHVPGLTLPGSPAATRAMPSAMGHMGS